MDPVRGRVRGVGVWGAGLGADTRVRHSHSPRQVVRYVQSNHLPVSGPEELLLALLFQGPWETPAFPKVQVRECIFGHDE